MMRESKDSHDNDTRRQVATSIIPKDEARDDVPSTTMSSGHIVGDVASSSGSSLRSFFIGMGFSPPLVDRVLDEKGEDNVDILLETLVTYSANSKPDPESSDSFDEIYCDSKDRSNPALFETESYPKKVTVEKLILVSEVYDAGFDWEPDMHKECRDVKRSYLLAMKFSIPEIEFAIDKLGGDASVEDLVDFIIAAQIAKNSELDEDATHVHEEKNEDDEELFGTMNKSLRLLEMGFSENEISLAIEKFGSGLPIEELADSILAGQIFDTSTEEDKRSVSILKDNLFGGSEHTRMMEGLKRTDAYKVKSEYNLDDASKSRCTEEVSRKGKKPRHNNMDSSSSSSPSWYEDIKPNPTRYWTTPQRDLQRVEKAFEMSKSNQCSSSLELVAKRPYFFYANVMDIPSGTWAKISDFLYGCKPELTDTQLFSALKRKEGYIHNLPTENRFHVLPKPPMTIQAAVPHTKKWWPSWDTRKQFNIICCETNGISQLCDRLGRSLIESQGLISVDQQNDIVHHCSKWNLLWVGKHKLSPAEPELIERILGYPTNHTKDAAFGLVERLQSLDQCFQIDTLCYHLSGLKTIFAEGLTVLSIYSGIGGVEIALRRLGIHLKGVVSVEPSETKRRILKRWWQVTKQTGELVQIEDIERLAQSQLELLVKRFGGFDLVICQNQSNLSPKSSRMGSESGRFAGFDFSMFCEFVRVLQSVRSILGRIE